MSQSTNRLLTLIVLLQAMTLAGQWLGGPTIAPAQAQLPDAGAQRMQIIDELKSMNAKLDHLSSLLDGGNLQVRVVKSDENKDAGSAKP